MDIYRLTALINLSVFILFFIIGIIIQIVRGISPVGERKNENKYMSFLIIFSILLLIFLWISYIFDFKFINDIATLAFIKQIIIIKWISAVIMCIATLIEIITGLTLGKSFKIHSQKENEPIILITKGIYRIIRNPVVLGIFFYAFSITLLNPNIFTLIMLIIVLISYNYKVDIEVRELEKRLGFEWSDYCNKTGKYFPGIFRKSKI